MIKNSDSADFYLRVYGMPEQDLQEILLKLNGKIPEKKLEILKKRTASIFKIQKQRIKTIL